MKGTKMLLNVTGPDASHSLRWFRICSVVRAGAGAGAGAGAAVAGAGAGACENETPRFSRIAVAIETTPVTVTEICPTGPGSTIDVSTVKNSPSGVRHIGQFSQFRIGSTSEELDE